MLFGPLPKLPLALTLGAMMTTIRPGNVVGPKSAPLVERAPVQAAATAVVGGVMPKRHTKKRASSDQVSAVVDAEIAGFRAQQEADFAAFRSRTVARVADLLGGEEPALSDEDIVIGRTYCVKVGRKSRLIPAVVLDRGKFEGNPDTVYLLEKPPPADPTKGRPGPATYTRTAAEIFHCRTSNVADHDESDDEDES